MENRIPSHRGTVVLALFAAIIVVLAFTPLGFIPLPFIKMTIIHIPVILGALLPPTLVMYPARLKIV